MNILGRILGVLCQAIGLAPMAAAQSNSTNGFDLNEVWYVVIGAVIGFISSIGSVVVERVLDRRGKLKLYYRLFGKKSTIPPFGFAYTKEGYMSFSIPMQLEIQNTSRTTRVILDFNVILCKNGIPVDHMAQITSATNSKTRNGETVEIKSHTYGTENGAYCFVVEALSILHLNCSFFYTQDEKGITFDEAKLRYYDEKDKEHSYSLQKIENCWEECLFEGTPDWVLLK